MIPTLTWTSKKFDTFNAEFFGGILAAPIFQITKTRSFLGQVSWRYVPGTIRSKYTSSGRRVRVGDVAPSETRLKMSAFYDRPERELENILLHEMIHLWFVQTDRPEIGHGPEFKAEAARIHRESRGAHVITITDSATRKTVASGVKRKEYVVYFLREQNSGRLAYATSLTHQKTRLERSLKSWAGKFVILKECVSSADKLQGRTPTVATYGTKASGRYASPSYLEDLWSTGKSKKVYARAV